MLQEVLEWSDRCVDVEMKGRAEQWAGVSSC